MKFTSIGDSYLKKAVQDKSGGLLLSAHVGNWEVAGNFLQEKIDVSTPMHIVMLDAEVENIKKNIISTSK